MADGLPEILANFVLEQETTRNNGYCLNSAFAEPFKTGWVRQLTLREICHSRVGDAYYITPPLPKQKPRKLRSWPAVEAFIEANPRSCEGLSSGNFTFGCRSISVGSWAGEIVRRASVIHSTAAASATASVPRRRPRKNSAAGLPRPRGRPRKNAAAAATPLPPPRRQRPMSVWEKASRATDRQLAREKAFALPG
jgi:hypothetical protein